VSPSNAHGAIDAVFRIEFPRLVAGLARVLRDVGQAEELAQDALVVALERWPDTGIPDNPGAWLMATAKRRAIDQLRRRTMLERKHAEIGRELEALQDSSAAGLEQALDDDVGDDLLRLMFTACHPVLSTDARVALTLRLLGGLTTDEIARAFLVPESTIAQRIVRAKRTLADQHVPFEVPRGEDRAARLSSVLEAIYLVFNEGYSATAGQDWMRPALCEDALRLGRVLAELAPQEPEVHGLVALMEIQASRASARVGPAGEPVLLMDQDRSRWDRLLIARGLAARSQRAAGGHRGLPRARGRAGRHGLAPDRRAVRGAGAAHAVARRRAESGGRGVASVRAGGRAGRRGRPARRAGAPGLSPPPQRPRRPAGEALASRRGPRRVRACGLPDAQRGRARAAARTRGRLRRARPPLAGRRKPRKCGADP
jgi:RNA polymerase sigma factor (sigma-70 family)